MIKFSDWIIARESSAFTRLRNAAAQGLMPPIPDASINSRSTATPFEQKSLKGKGTKKRKRKKKVDSAPFNKTIDMFVKAAEDLKKDIENLKKNQKTQKKQANKEIEKEKIEKKEIEKEEAKKDKKSNKEEVKKDKKMS